MPTYNQLSDGRPDGVQIGIDSSDKVAFFGGTPVARRTKATAVATTAATSTTNAYGYTTAAQADAIVTAVNAIIVNLTDMGVTD